MFTTLQICAQVHSSNMVVPSVLASLFLQFVQVHPLVLLWMVIYHSGFPVPCRLCASSTPSVPAHWQQQQGWPQPMAP